MTHYPENEHVPGHLSGPDARANTARDQYMALRSSRRGLVLDQLAFYAPTEEAEQRVKASLGLAHADWTQDEASGAAWVWGDGPSPSRALLQFNYDLGIEVEVLRYLDGPHWHDPYLKDKSPGQFGFLSHIGFHVNDGELPRLPFRIAQELITEHHTNPAIAGRSYHYRIFDTRQINGVFMKYIKRLR